MKKRSKFFLPTVAYFVGTALLAICVAINCQSAAGFFGIEGAALVIYAMIVALARSDYDPSSSGYDL